MFNLDDIINENNEDHNLKKHSRSSIQNVNN